MAKELLKAVAGHNFYELKFYVWLMRHSRDKNSSAGQAQCFLAFILILWALHQPMTNPYQFFHNAKYRHAKHEHKGREVDNTCVHVLHTCLHCGSLPTDSAFCPIDQLVQFSVQIIYLKCLLSQTQETTESYPIHNFNPCQPMGINISKGGFESAQHSRHTTITSQTVSFV